MPKNKTHTIYTKKRKSLLTAAAAERDVLLGKIMVVNYYPTGMFRLLSLIVADFLCVDGVGSRTFRVCDFGSHRMSFIQLLNRKMERD